MRTPELFNLTFVKTNALQLYKILNKSSEKNHQEKIEIAFKECINQKSRNIVILVILNFQV